MDVSTKIVVFDGNLDFSWSIHHFFDPGSKKIMDVSTKIAVFDRNLDFCCDIHHFFDPGSKKLMDVSITIAALSKMEAGGHPALRVNQEMKEKKLEKQSL